MTYDIAIIGAGPAGLSAALNSKIRNKSVILFGKDSEKLVKTKKISNYLGFTDISGFDLNEKFKKSLKDFEIKRDTRKVKTIYAMGSYFAIEIENESQMIEARSVIMATGIELKKDLGNEEKFFAKGVNYCATCDAALYRGKKVVVIGYNDESVAEANFTSEIVGSLVFVNMTGREVSLNEGIDLIEGEIPLGFEGSERAKKLIFKSGREIIADGFFIEKDSSKAERLVPCIKMEDNHILTSKDTSTSIKGLFAAGDITGKPYQIMKAVGEGQVAALKAVSYLASKN
ncbi:NAD(P)/FAD-dependent oxidoreductase [Anaerococcus degeneri]|uniref:NAD(P)/FAD-dependent oxidoreductase n=1 Tax=Anaerococcus degeneri TaxID=361500 RepID=A0ABS7YXA1_9FIRM|nr:NAD(P)/FAD-dependent oxidoreductase [Anaerococcus degeneri]MBP2015379.1 thioredoxin reductase (NADPH) [Anaerococcus degeneri]MCA2096273.1 NAD(P)/FAD-dependent oxidoreductase [Anaerococcus degeneri]